MAAAAPPCLEEQRAQEQVCGEERGREGGEDGRDLCTQERDLLHRQEPRQDKAEMRTHLGDEPGEEREPPQGLHPLPTLFSFPPFCLGL